MAYTIVTDDLINLFSGENADDSVSTAQKEALEDSSIARLSAWARYDVSSNYSEFPSTIKGHIAEYIARQIAVAIIGFNMSGYTSRIEGEDMININIYENKKLEKIFQDQKFWTYIKGE